MSIHERSITELTSKFERATRGLRDNSKGTDLHKWQVDFAYLLNDIARGPNYIAPKFIDSSNQFIDSIISARKEQASA